MGQGRKVAKYLPEGIIGFLCTPIHEAALSVHNKAALHKTGAVANFLEFHTGEVRRIPLPHTSVNKAGRASSETRSNYTRGARRHLRLYWVLLLLAMLARQVGRSSHNDQDHRHHTPQRSAQPG